MPVPDLLTGAAAGFGCAATLLLWANRRRYPPPCPTSAPARASTGSDPGGPGPDPAAGAQTESAVMASPLPDEAGSPGPGLEGKHPYRALFEAHPGPMWVFDEETLHFLAVNEAVVHGYGYTRDRLLRLTVRDVSPAEDADRLAGTPGEPVVWRHRAASGALLAAEVVTARAAAGGRVVRLVVATKTTGGRRAEETLRGREALLRSLLAHIPCGVFWKDRASIYLGCNDQFARDHGLAAPGEVVGQTDDHLVAPAEADGHRASDRRVIETGTALLNVEEALTRPDGGKAILLTSRVPSRDESGRVVGVLGVYQDVTDRKQLEAQFRQAQKMEAIGRLAGGVAHDFNNLLTIISCNVHLIQQLPPGDDGLGELVDDIRDAADRAASLTRQLLTFSRKQPSRPEVVDLTETVSGLAGLLRRLLGETITVRTEFADLPVRVRADKGQLEQVVMNLAVNAKDAMAGGGTLTIGTARVDGPECAAVLTIADTGCGMTDEVKARIFEPFFTTKEIGKGTGLGLATVYGIVDAAGGRVEVDSAVGVGTTFRVRLPWCEAAQAPSAVTRAPAADAASGAGRRVLLVEDEERIRNVARLTLQGQGYAVVEADRAEAALRHLTAGREFDLLVTDLVMPGLDGRELAARVRAARPDIGVVFISGYAPDPHRLDEVPGAVFLPKPFSPPDLLRVAVRAVGRTKAGRAAREARPAG